MIIAHKEIDAVYAMIKPTARVELGAGWQEFTDDPAEIETQWPNVPVKNIGNPAFWTEDPIMTGDQRAYGGKTWVSLVDYNVWTPPIGWREVTQGGAPPDWVQPTGAHDAYNIGDQVTFQGSVYESVINANVWSPIAYPAGWKTV